MHTIQIPLVHMNCSFEHKHICPTESWYAVITYEKHRRDSTLVHWETKQPWAVSIWQKSKHGAIQYGHSLDICAKIKEYPHLSRIYVCNLSPERLIELGNMLYYGGIRLIPASATAEVA